MTQEEGIQFSIQNNPMLKMSIWKQKITYPIRMCLIQVFLIVLCLFLRIQKVIKFPPYSTLLLFFNRPIINFKKQIHHHILINLLPLIYVIIINCLFQVRIYHPHFNSLLVITIIIIIKYGSKQHLLCRNNNDNKIFFQLTQV